jgi:hypothetical protein
VIISVLSLRPRPQAIALILTMPDDPANYNIAGMSLCTANRFVGGCAVWATAGKYPVATGAMGSALTYGAYVRRIGVMPARSALLINGGQRAGVEGRRPGLRDMKDCHQSHSRR